MAKVGGLRLTAGSKWYQILHPCGNGEILPPAVTASTAAVFRGRDQVRQDNGWGAVGLWDCMLDIAILRDNTATQQSLGPHTTGRKTRLRSGLWPGILWLRYDDICFTMGQHTAVQ